MSIDRSYLVYAKQTLDQVITSPMFDFIDGGVHRYSLHPEWLSPNFEMTLIDQIHFIRILIQVYFLSGSTIYLEFAEFNLNFVLKQFKQPEGLFSMVRYEKEFPGSYYFFNTDFLDSISPLDFLRVPFDDQLNLVAMVKPNDLLSVGRSKLKMKRRNSKFKINNDPSISAKEQALLLDLLLQMKQTMSSNVYDEQINNLMLYFRELPFDALELLDLLIIYDVLIKITPQPNLDLLISEIKLHLTDQFPFMNSFDFLPLDDIGHDGLTIIEQTRTIFDNYNLETKILAASIRHPMHILDAAQIGADVATVPTSTLLKLFDHPLTKSGIEAFMNDAKAWSVSKA